MTTSTKPLRPRNFIRAIANEASVAMTSEPSTASRVTVKLLPTISQNCGAPVAVLKCVSVPRSGRKTGVLLMMSLFCLKAVLNIQ